MSATRNHTTHLVKIGNTYATRDLRFHLIRKTHRWILKDRQTDTTILSFTACTNGALRLADETITRTLVKEQTA